ncbi:hypothetical protein CI102_4432 [Trichoderma harzianum]|nr:hypothetical protein CI102_4432 [Trichoderma harzianum]
MSSRAALPDQYLCLCELSGFPHLRVRTQQTAGWADGRDRLIRIPNRWSSNPPTLLTRARCMVACLMSRPCVRCAENSEREKQRRRLRAMPDERSSSDVREWPCRIPCPYQVATVATEAILEEWQSPRNLGRQIRGVWFSGILLYDPYEQFVLCCL